MWPRNKNQGKPVDPLASFAKYLLAGLVCMVIALALMAVVYLDQFFRWF